MATITLKQTLGHWVRLFGYFLGVAVVGGAVAGGGLALLEDVPNWAPGGAAPDVSIKLIAGAGLLAVGALVLLAGFFTIVLVVVATGVRYGVEAAGDDADGDRGEDESADEPVPDPADRLASRRRARRAPVTAHAEPSRSQERAESRSTGAPASEQPNEAERSDAADQGEDWMREVERDLVEDGPERARTASDESIVPPEDSTSAAEPSGSDSTPGEGRSETPAGDRERPDAEPDDFTPTDRAATSADDWVGPEEIGSGEPADDSESSAASPATDDASPERDEPTDDVVEPTDDRPPSSSDGPGEEPLDVTDGSDVSDDVAEKAGGGREATDDPLAPDDFEPEPVENDPEDATGVEEDMEVTDAEDATEPTDEETDWDDDSTDSDDEPR